MPNKVDRTGDTMTGPLNVIDTVTGSRNTQAVNGNRLQNDLDNYAMMLRTTGNQSKSGLLTMKGGVVITQNLNERKLSIPTSQVQTQPSQVRDNSGEQIYFVQLLTSTNGDRELVFNLYGTNGKRARVTLIKIESNGNVTFPWN